MSQMRKAKSEALTLIDSMDDNSSMDDIMYKLYVLDKHHKALREIQGGQIYTTQEVRKSLGDRHETAIVD